MYQKPAKMEKRKLKNLCFYMFLPPWGGQLVSLRLMSLILKLKSCCLEASGACSEAFETGKLTTCTKDC